MKTIENTTATATATLNLDIYIVLKDTIPYQNLPTEERKRLTALLGATEFSGAEPLVQVCLGGVAGAEDIIKRGLQLRAEDKKPYWTRIPTAYVPASMLWGVREGDPIILDYLLLAAGEELTELRLRIIARASQQKYSAISSFEEALSLVVPLKFSAEKNAELVRKMAAVEFVELCI